MCCRKKTDLNYNNMQDKVSEKAIWEGSIPSENENTQFSSFQQSQPQMMFCYKCNNVIPGNSKYCPCCKVELFTTCPKCGAKYSSQYHICNQCGTDRDEYLQAQRIEQEKKEAVEREMRRKKEIEERKRKEAEAERERQEMLRRYEQEANKKKQKKAYVAENNEITKTAEYKSAYSALKEIFANAFEMHNKKCKLMGFLSILCSVLMFIPFIILCCIQGVPNIGFFVATGIPFILLILLIIPYNKVYHDRTIYLKKCYTQYISDKDNYDEGLLTQDLIDMAKYQGFYRLSDCCIVAYREKYGLDVNYKWHNLK